MGTRTRVRAILCFIGVAAMTSACSQNDPALDAADVERWLAAYGTAWESKNADAAAELFAENASYHETPYADPFRGREGISEYWARVTADQTDIDFQAEVVGVVDDIGIARWSAIFTSISSGARVELNGVFLLEFDQSKLCAVLREWWHAR